MNWLDKKVISRIFIIGIVVILFMISMYNNSNYRKNSLDDIIYLDKGWTFNKNGKVEKDVTLSKFNFDIANKGDEIILSCILPNKKIPLPILVYEQYHCLVDVYVDGLLVDKKGYEEDSDKEAVGYGIYTVDLPNDYCEKELMIKLHVKQDKAFPQLSPMRIENEGDYISNLIRLNIFEIFTTLYMFIIGLVILITSVFIGKFSKGYRKLIEIGFILVFTSIWILANHSTIKIIVDDLETITYMVYVFGHMAILSVIIFFTEITDMSIYKKILKCVIGLYGLIILKMIICEVFNTSHVTEEMSYLNMTTIICAFFFVISIICGYKNKTKSERAMIKGLFVILVTGGMQTVIYTINKFFGFTIEYSKFVLLGINLFVLMMLDAYIMNIKEFVSEDIKKKYLHGMAYTDQLTGLYNRSKCMEKLDSFDNEKNSEYAIINFDLNFLKVVNDKLGHVKGDEYLCEFADILSLCFSDIGLVGRMGGDEFIAIVDGENMSYIDVKIEEMDNIIEEKNRIADKKYDISYAHGYCVKNKNNSIKSNEVYELADKLMYDCKKQQKKGRDFNEDKLY